MQLHTGQILRLLDAEQRTLGEVTVEGNENELVLGRFVPAAAFAAVADRFRAFEEAANAQALSAIDELDAAIAALGLSLVSVEGNQQIHAQDVQIWSDGGISFRLASRPPTTLNGSQGVAQPVRSAGE